MNKGETFITSLAVVGAMLPSSREYASPVGVSELLNSDKTSVASIVGPREELLRSLSIDEGFLTVYDPGVWEKEIYRRTGDVSQGHEYENPSPILNPEIASDHELMKLVHEKNIIAINAAMISEDYRELMMSLANKARRAGANDNDVREIINKHNEEFVRIAYRDALGKVLEITTGATQPTEVVIMSVFTTMHAAEDLGLIPPQDRKNNMFVGDVHNDFMEKTFGIRFDYGSGWWVDGNGNSVPPKDIPWVYLILKNDRPTQ